MANLSFRIRDKCVWWLCTLVAMVPVAIVLWLAYMMFYE